MATLYSLLIITCAYEQLYVLQESGGEASSSPSQCTSGTGSSPGDRTTASEETVVQDKPLQVQVTLSTLI